MWGGLYGWPGRGQVLRCPIYRKERHHLHQETYRELLSNSIPILEWPPPQHPSSCVLGSSPWSWVSEALTYTFKCSMDPSGQGQPFPQSLGRVNCLCYLSF